jgi:hypothetical protein
MTISLGGARPAAIAGSHTSFSQVSSRRTINLLVVGDVQGVNVRRDFQGQPQCLAGDGAPSPDWQQSQEGLQVLGDDDPTFVKQGLFKDLASETHALHCVDINGDGMKDLMTGKRW